MSDWVHLVKHFPLPGEVIVHERSRPTLPFGFRQGSGIKWTPGPPRRTRDEATVTWAKRMREEP